MSEAKAQRVSPSVEISSDPPRDVSAIPKIEGPARPICRLTGPREPRFQVVINRSALEAIHEHGKEKTDVEICGVMVGRVYHDANGPYLRVHASVRGESAANKETQVTFTAETWTSIQTVMDRDYPDDRIVGWYHTHPGFGVFLSGMDLFIQDNFFNLPWQVAMVYDPLSGEEGVFVWRAGKSERDEMLIEEDQGEWGIDWRQKLNPDRKPLSSSTRGEPSIALRVALAIVVFALSFGVTWAVMRWDFFQR